jgi:hypothetical protein
MQTFACLHCQPNFAPEADETWDLPQVTTWTVTTQNSKDDDQTQAKQGKKQAQVFSN